MAVTVKAIIKNRANADGSHTVFIRITKDREYILHSAGVRIDKKHWNEKGNYEKHNWIRSTLSNAEQENVSIKKIIDKVKKITSEDPDVQLSQIESILKGLDSGDFIQFWKDHMAIRNIGLSPNSVDKYDSQLNNFIEYTKNKPVPFSLITYEFIIKYEAWILGKGNKQSTCSKAMGFLRTIVKEAIKSGYIKRDKNPFDDFTIKGYTTHKERLTKKEIEIFEQVPARRELMQECVHMFLIEYYAAGARVSDVIQMRWDFIIDGRWYYDMDKTDRMKNIKLSPKAIEILKLYGYGEKKTGYVFRFVNDEVIKKAGDKFHKKIQSITALINKNIKLFAKENSITKNISNHVARHSFADNARKASKDVYAISKALGHKKISTTENYIASLDDGAVDDLLDLMA